jgi:LPXTG-motif cell wall-anchored protein
LTPGQTLTCSATHVVTQVDLDQGAVTDAASVTGLAPSGAAVAATSAIVVVPATRITSLSLIKTSSSDAFARVGDQVVYRITASNNGNLTLMNVAISDPNAVLSGCPPTNLAPGQSVSCTAVHTATAADVAAKVILNQAHATALPMISLELVCPLMAANGAACPGQTTVSAESNTVVLNRSALLPKTGATVVSKLLLGGGLFGLGELLLLVGRRRRRPAR